MTDYLLHNYRLLAVSVGGPLITIALTFYFHASLKARIEFTIRQLSRSRRQNLLEWLPDFSRAFFSSTTLVVFIWVMIFYAVLISAVWEKFPREKLATELTSLVEAIDPSLVSPPLNLATALEKQYSGSLPFACALIDLALYHATSGDGTITSEMILPAGLSDEEVSLAVSAGLLKIKRNKVETYASPESYRHLVELRENLEMICANGIKFILVLTFGWMGALCILLGFVSSLAGLMVERRHNEKTTAFYLGKNVPLVRVRVIHTGTNLFFKIFGKLTGAGYCRAQCQDSGKIIALFPPYEMMADLPPEGVAIDTLSVPLPYGSLIFFGIVLLGFHTPVFHVVHAVTGWRYVYVPHHRLPSAPARLALMKRP